MVVYLFFETFDQFDQFLFNFVNCAISYFFIFLNANVTHFSVHFAIWTIFSDLGE